MFENLAQLRTARAKRVFAFTAILLLATEFVALDVIYGNQKRMQEPYFSILTNVLGNLAASSIAAIVIMALLVYLIPVEEALHDIELHDPGETATLHRTALAQTDFWFHHGQIGRWVRVTAMPMLAVKARERGATVAVKLILLNPRNAAVCALFADYRNRIAFKDTSIRTVDDVKAEILATIVVGHLYDQSENGLTVETYLSDHLTLMREDISALAVFRTQIDPRCPALVYHNHNERGRRSEFYNAAKADFQFAVRCCAAFDAALLPRAALTHALLKGYLKDRNLLVSESTDFVDNVLARVQSDYHPYN